MPLQERVPSGPGREVTYGSGSNAQLNLAGEQSGDDWAAVECARP
jgi:hypothetical protein